MSDLAAALEEAGGTGAPPAASARLRALLGAELERSEGELTKSRSGYGTPVVVAVSPGLIAVLPLRAEVRADPDAVPERAWLLAAAAVGALVELAALPAPREPADLRLRAGVAPGGFLALELPARDEGLDELAPLAFEEQAAGIDRLKAAALALPAAAIQVEDLRSPIGANHPLRVAEAIARLGGRPAAPDPELEDAVLAVLEPPGGASRPHEDPDPVRRVARRILQRLNGMGKWGGYHTEFAHLARGFAPGERRLAAEVGEALLEAGLLAEKPSVGQRHVFLNPRRAKDIHRLIDQGDVPARLTLPS